MRTEYRIIRIHHLGPVAETEQREFLGYLADGWKIVSASYLGHDSVVYVMSRETEVEVVDPAAEAGAEV